MTAILDQANQNILGGQSFGEAQRSLPRNITVALAMQQPHRAEQINIIPQQQVVPPILDQQAGKALRFGSLLAPQADGAGFQQGAPLCRVKVSPDQILGKIERGRDADQSDHPAPEIERRQSRDPAAQA